MTGFDEDVRLTVYAEGVETLGGAVAFTVREDQLEGVESLGGSRARPLDARAETLRSTFTVVDENNTLSSEIFDSNGRPRVLNRLFQIEIRWNSATWKNVAVGRVLDVEDVAGTGYKFQIADEGQLLREQSAFAVDHPAPFGGGADTAAVLPMGLIDAWGGVGTGVDPITPMSYYVTGDTAGPNDNFLAIRLHGPDDAISRKGPARMSSDVQDLILGDLRADGSPFALQPAIDDQRGGFKHLRFHEVGSDTDLEVAAKGDLTGSIDEDGEHRKAMQQPKILWLYWPNHGKTEGDTGECYLYMPGKEPSETLPKHFGGETGVQQWQHVKDGLDAVGLRYDTSAINDLIGTGETIWPRVTEDLSMLEHLRRTVLLSEGYMLAPNTSGEMSPVRIASPRPEDTASPPTLDESTIGPDRPTWKHSRREQKTVITFTVHTVTSAGGTIGYAGPPIKGDPTKIQGELSGAADGLHVVTYEIEKTHRVDDFGRRELKVDLAGFKDRQQFERVASTLAEALFSRWGDGLMVSQFGALKGNEDLSPGDYLFVSVDDFPNPALQGRGGTRFMQVLERVKDLRPGVDLKLADAGKDNQPLNAPSVSASQNANHPRSVLDVSVSNIPSNASGWVVEYAKSATDPADSSDLWTRLGGDANTSASDSIKLTGAEADATYWFRVRVFGYNRVASPWSSHASATTGTLASITNLSVSNITGSEALATWTVPNDDQPVRFQLRNVTQASVPIDQRLPGGTEQKLATGLVAGEDYEVIVQLIDDAGKATGPTVVQAFTAGATNDTLPSPDFIGIQYGRPSHRGEQSNTTVRTGVVVWTVPADPAVPLHFQRAPDDGSGNPDTTATEEFRLQVGEQQFVDEEVHPGGNNGDGYWYRALHKAEGYNDSAPTEWARAFPVALPSSIGAAPSEPLVDIDLRIDGSGNVSLFFDGKREIKAIRYDVGTSNFSSLDPTTGTLVTTDSDGDADVGNIITLSQDQTAFVEVTAYLEASGDGGVVASRSGSITRGSGAGSDTIYPEVDAQSSQPSGGTGRLDLVIYDEQLRVTAIEFQKKTGSGDFSGTWSTGWDNTGITPGSIGSDETLRRNEDIALDDQHNVAIKYRVTFTDKDSNSQTKAGTVEFDSDEAAQVEASAYLDTEGDLIVTIRGDEDVDTGQAPSLKLWAGTSDPDTTTAPDYTADNTREVVKVDTGLDFNTEFAYVTVKGVNSRGEDGPPQKILATANPADPVPPFTVTVSEDRAAASASVSVDINGSESYDIEILQVESDGTTTSLVSNTGVTDGGANDPTTANPSLSEKVSTILKVVVKNSTTGETLHEETHTFDPLEKPDFSVLSAQASPEGKIQVIFLGDVDTSSYQIEYDPDGDGTAEQTVTADGSSAVDTSNDSMAEGTTGQVTVTLYSGTGQTGASISETLQVPFRVGPPFLGQNINDWNGTPTGGLSGTDKRFGIRINLSAPEVIVGFLNADESSTQVTYEVELEFSTEVTIDGVNTGDDTGVWSGSGDNASVSGQVVTLSGNHSTGGDAYTINCTGLNSDSVIAVRLKRYDHGSLTWNVSLGDRIVRSSPDDPIIPFEFRVTPSDASFIDIGRLLNAGDLAELNAIDTTEITDSAVTTPKVNAGAITAAKIQAGTITANEILADTITANEIAADTITAAEIAANTITASQIAANTITASQIAADTITADQIAADTITASEVQAGSITATELSVSKLDDIADDAGILVAGELRGVTGNSEIDLNATGNSPFLSTTDFVIEADGDAFFSNTVRGEQIDHGSVSGTVTLNTANGNIHYFNLSGNTTIDVNTPAGLVGVTLVVAVDHNGNTLSWSESSSTTNLYAPGGTIPTGTGQTIFTLCAYEVVSGPTTRWALAKGPENLQNVF